MGGRRKEYAFRFIDSQLYLILHPVEAEWFEEVDILGRGSVEGTIGHPRLLLKSCYRRIQIGTKSLSGVEECPDIGRGEFKRERFPCGFLPAVQQALATPRVDHLRVPAFASDPVPCGFEQFFSVSS